MKLEELEKDIIYKLSEINGELLGNIINKGNNIVYKIDDVEFNRSIRSFYVSYNAIIKSKNSMIINGDKYNKVEGIDGNNRIFISFLDSKSSKVELQLGAYDKFSKAREILYEDIKNNGYTLISSYTGNKNKICIDFKCGHQPQMVSVDNYKAGCRCTLCSCNLVIKGINDVSTTHPHLIKYFVNIEDAYKYSHGSNKRIKVKCCDCGKVKQVTISNLVQYGFSCDYCSKGLKYPERFVISFLNQLVLNGDLDTYKTQLSEKCFDWIIDKKRYDFYFEYNDEQYIIETHGKQHYEYTGFKRTLEEEKENDEIKKQLAFDNGFNNSTYIVVDCRKSELDFIKNNILESNLANIFDLSRIDWRKCAREAESNIIKMACEVKSNNQDITTTDISNMFEINRCTAKEWLKKGNELGWCYYNAKEEKSKSSARVGKANKKII